MKTIKITCSGDSFLPWREIKEFQGNLKLRTTGDIEHLVDSILKYGFSFPFFIWKKPGGTNACLDGHGRLLALEHLSIAGYVIPDLPVVYIDAENEEEAREILIRINSSTGEITNVGFRDLVCDIPDLNLDEYHFPDLDLEAVGKELEMLQTADAIITGPEDKSFVDSFNSLIPDPVKEQIPSPPAEFTPPAPPSAPRNPVPPSDTPKQPSNQQEVLLCCPVCGEKFVHHRN